MIAEPTDIVTWSRYRPGRAKIVYDLIDSYLALGRGPIDTVRAIGKYALGEIARPAASYHRLVAKKVF